MRRGLPELTSMGKISMTPFISHSALTSLRLVLRCLCRLLSCAAWAPYLACQTHALSTFVRLELAHLARYVRKLLLVLLEVGDPGVGCALRWRRTSSVRLLFDHRHRTLRARSLTQTAHSTFLRLMEFSTAHAHFMRFARLHSSTTGVSRRQSCFCSR